MSWRLAGSSATLLLTAPVGTVGTIDTAALSTISPTVIFVEIVCRQEVPPFAVSSCDIPAKSIFLQRYCIQMIRSNAMPDTAQMVNFVPIRNETYPQDICIAMGISLSPAPTAFDCKESIPIWFDATCPQPTVLSRLQHHIEKSLLLGSTARPMKSRTRHTPANVSGRWS